MPHLTGANHSAALAPATHNGKREIEELVAELAPRRDVPAAIRTLPISVGTAVPLGSVRVETGASGQLGPDRVGRATGSLPVILLRPWTLAGTPGAKSMQWPMYRQDAARDALVN